MEVVALGTAGPDGIPVTGCGCPACLAATAGRGPARSPAAVQVDGTRLTAAGPADRRTAGGDRVLWLPAADEPDDATLAAPAGGGPAAAVAVIGARTPTGAAHALARLRGAGAVDDATGCALVGWRHDGPPPDEVALRARHWGLTLPEDGDLLMPAPPRPAGDRLPRRTLVLGGIRSGKSALAEDLLAAEPAVVYLAAGAAPAGDDDAWARRVAAHRARRPAWWHTVEGTDLAAATAGRAPVLLDSTGSWLAATLESAGAWSGTDGWRETYRAARGRLLLAWRDTQAPVVAVAEEVGSMLVPTTASGRLFADELGRLHQLLAAGSEQVLQCVAGRTVVVASPPEARTASSTGTGTGTGTGRAGDGRAGDERRAGAR